ncbi:MAG TPA: peptidylprolyl isomerase [Elusimicrobiota bacterium]|nr:peptidylprolyl isomerase [Elusimicrobiota bacterium]
MKRTQPFVWMLSAAAALAPVSVAVAKVMDRTLATVNGQAILLSEFEKNSTPILEQFRKATPPADQTPDRVSDIKKRVLDQMIDDRLLLQEAKKNNLRVSQLETDEGVKKVRSRFATEAEFNDELKKEGMTYEEFRTHIQDQLATIKLIDQEVKAKTPQPTDDDIKKLYDTLQDIIQDKPLPSGHTSSEIDELKSLAHAVQHRFSERIRARHILVRVAPDASEADKKAAMDKIKDVQAQLKKGADFGDLAKKYSDDPGSKDRGGDLGYFSHGDMVPAFEKVAFGLDVGQTSDIVTTDYGYHIIRVEEKKAASPMSFDEIKDDLKDYLFQQRGAKRFEDYVKNLRSKAEIKVNNLE